MPVPDRAEGVCGARWCGLGRQGGRGSTAICPGTPGRRRSRLAATSNAALRVGGGRREVAPDRPVSYGRASFEALLARFEQVAAEHREQLGMIVAEAEDLITTVGDVDAAAYEVAEAHRAAEIRIAQAQTAQAVAERAAGAARRDAAAALEEKAQADAAAEEALTELETLRTRTAEQLAEYQAATEQAQADQRAAAAELEEVRAAAATAVAKRRLPPRRTSGRPSPSATGSSPNASRDAPADRPRPGRRPRAGHGDARRGRRRES